MENTKVTLVETIERDSGRHKCALCRCNDCGEIIKMRYDSYIAGGTSCDCWKVRKNNKRLYSIWFNMKNRCLNPNTHGYDKYGGRGIAVCEQWRNSSKSFIEWAKANGYEDGLTLDRIDNDGDYEPLNCRWVSRQKQQNNRRCNRRFFGMTLTELCREYGLSVNAERTYLSRHGYDAEAKRLKTKLIELGGVDES
jgi:hypothetical protein